MKVSNSNRQKPDNSVPTGVTDMGKFPKIPGEANSIELSGNVGAENFTHI